MSRVLLASDFDGTIVPHTAVPGAMRWHPATRELFGALQHRDDVALAIVSGRDPDELAAAARGIRCHLVGSYGRHIRDAHGAVLRSEPPLVLHEGAWADVIRAKGGIVERKRHGVAIHWRTPGTIRSRCPAMVAFRAWARLNQLRLIPGRASCEAVVPGPGKYDALCFLGRLVGADHVIYAGDDWSDVAALRWAARRGHAFFVGAADSGLQADNVNVVASITELWESVSKLRCLCAPASGVACRAPRSAGQPRT